MELVTDKISDGKVGVQFHVGANEGKTAGDLRLQAGAASRYRAQKFRRTLAFRVCRSRIERIGAGGRAFRDVADIRRLRAIDGSRA